jgi:hypothetical protein
MVQLVSNDVTAKDQVDRVVHSSFVDILLDP